MRENFFGLLSDCRPNSSAPTAPFIAHVSDEQYLNRAECIHVGYVSSPSSFSPWCMPLPCENFQNNKNFMLMRADLHIFLRPLSNKIISRSCTSSDDCWGEFIQGLFIDVFDLEDSDVYSPPIYTEGPPPSDTDEEDSDGPPPSSEGRGSFDVSNVNGRHRDLMSSGVQGARGRPGQLICDGLPPDAHLHRALSLEHPYETFSGTTPAVEYALKRQTDASTMISNRKEIISCLYKLSNMLSDEDDEFIRLAPPGVSAVLKAYCVKRVAFMREFVHLCSPEDYAVVSILVMGLPMLGWSCPAFGLMDRVNHPIQSIEDFTSTRILRNSKIIERLGASKDAILDKLAYDKTLAEVEAGVTFGPYTSVDSIPVNEPCLAARQGIWEEHGDAIAPTVRIIDDLLYGEQNSTTGTCQAHRPTDVDGLVSQTRAVADSCNSKLFAWTSDFAKAFKQVPADPSQRSFVVLAQFSPSAGQVAYFVTNCQVFGSKSSPLNFSRYPALFCWCAAVLFSIAATHCVDDVISVENSASAASGMEAWENFMELCG